MPRPKIVRFLLVVASALTLIFILVSSPERLSTATLVSRTNEAAQSLEELIAHAPPQPDPFLRTPQNGEPVPTNIRFLAVPHRDVCAEPRALILTVIGAAKNADRRRIIRSTYGKLAYQPDAPYWVVFVVGTSDDKDVLRQIDQEQRNYGDILQYDANDTYDGLTIKMLATLQFLDACRPAEIVLKIDDDVAFCPWLLIRYFKAQTRKHKFTTRTFVGYEYYNSKAIHEAENKWAVERRVADGLYPKYVSGTCYAFAVRSAGTILKQARRMRFFKLEDVFLTGYVRQSIGFKLLALNKFMRKRASDKNLELLLDSRLIITAVERDDDIVRAWSVMEDRHWNESYAWRYEDARRAMN